MWERRLTGLAVAVVAVAAGAIPFAQSVINAQQDAADLPRLGETAAEYQARLSRTQTIARGGDAGTRVQGDPRGAKSSAGKAIAMFQPGMPEARGRHPAEE
jgi:hypothetical protein